MPPRIPLVLAIAALSLSACRAGTEPSEPSAAAPSVAVSAGPSAEPVQEPYAGAEAVVTVARGPRGVAFHDGSIWVASTLGDVIQRVDPATNEVVAEIRAGQRPVTLVTIGESLWASLLNGDASSDDEVVRIDSATNTVDLRVSVTVFHNIATGAGAVWVIGGDGQLRRVDAASGEVMDATLGGSGTVGLAADDTAVWGIRGDQTVWRYPATGGELLEASLEVPVPGRSRVAVGAGSLWVAVPGSVLALDPASLEPRAELALPGMELVNDLFVTSTDVWLSANLTDDALRLDGGSVLRLDPETLEIRESYRLGPESSGVVVGDGSVWAVDQSDHRLARFDL